MLSKEHRALRKTNIYLMAHQMGDTIDAKNNAVIEIMSNGVLS